MVQRVVKIGQEALAKSRLAERVRVEEGRNETSLARVQVTASEARAWRVTMNRADRQDGAAQLAPNAAPSGSAPIFSSQLYSYAAGVQNTPADPPVRSNRVGAPAADGDPLFVQLAWGMSEGGINRMIAHWPMQGASVVVTGSFVEVFAGSFLSGVVPAGALPLLGATIVPETGINTADNPELSIQQAEIIQVGYAAATDPVVLYVPDFARRVRVILADAETERPFDFGQPRLNMEWFTDSVPAFAIADTWQQGSSIGIAPEWQPVPARATLLRLGTPGANLDCGETPFTQCIAYVHWRVTP